jgi:hypothetical protein
MHPDFTHVTLDLGTSLGTGDLCAVPASSGLVVFAHADAAARLSAHGFGAHFPQRA